MRQLHLAHLLLITPTALALDFDGTKIQPNQTQLGDQLGNSVAIEGDSLVIGARYDHQTGQGSGSITLVDLATGNVVYQVGPTHSLVAQGRMGEDVAIQGATILAGAPGTSTNGGAAYLFDLLGNQLHRLEPDAPQSFSEFGQAVDLDGGLALIGAPFRDEGLDNSGAAYLFDTGTGTQRAKFQPSTPVEFGCFGMDVALHGDRAVIGTWGERAYVFDVVSGAELLTLAPSDVVPGDDFGRFVAISSSFVAVGAPSQGGAEAHGAVYVFDRTTGQELAKLLPPNIESVSYFGWSLTLSDTLLAIGTPSAQGGGAVYCYEVGTWEQHAYWSSPDPEGTDYGASVALDGSQLVVGDPWADVQGQLAKGAAYVHEVPSALGESFCGPAVPNSTGLPGELAAVGSPIAAEDCVLLFASQLAPSRPCMLVNSQTQGFVMPPGSQGNLCLGGAIGRHLESVQHTSSLGAASFPLGLTQLPTPNGTVVVQPGDTWLFQVWYRDANPQNTSNFTDGLRITFQ